MSMDGNLGRIFTGAHAKTEFEITYNLKQSRNPQTDIDNLRAIAKIISADADPAITAVVCDEVYSRKIPGMPAARLSNPITWYADTAEQDLQEQGTNFRGRIAAFSAKLWFQLAVKGDAQKFNGPGGLARHEDEITQIGRIHFNPASFSDPVSRRLLAVLNERDAHLYFSTDVERIHIPIIENSDGGRGVAEIAFDAIRYKVQTENPQEPLVTFHRLCQVETEYMNPRSEAHYEMGQQLGLRTLDEAHIEQVLQAATRRWMTVAEKLGIEVEASDPSKGCIGFQKLAEYQGLAKAVPPRPNMPVHDLIIP